MSRLLSARLIILEDSIAINDIDEDRTDIDEDRTDIDEDRTDIDAHDLSLLKKHRGSKKATLQPVFKVPPELGLYYDRALQDHENTASSN